MSTRIMHFLVRYDEGTVKPSSTQITIELEIDGFVDCSIGGIQNALDQAAREREEAAKLLGQQREILGQVRGEAQEILAEGRKAGERLRAELMEEAQKQKREILERSREEILKERDEALATLRRAAVDLSISAASRVLEKNLDSKDNRRLVEEYLEALSKEDGWDR